MVSQRIEDVTMVIFQKSRRIREKFSSSTPDFYAFKHICTVTAKEIRCEGTIDLTSFFL